MIFFFLGLTAVVLVALLSRDHDLSASHEVIVLAQLHLIDHAVAALPDRVHLSHCAPSAFTNLHPVQAAREGLRAEGFSDAGSYGVDELPSTHVWLLANARQKMTAVVYDQSGAVWVEVSSRYDDGRKWIHTTLVGLGVDTRPGNTLISLPGVCLAELLARARGDRPRMGLRPVSVRHVAPHWEQDYVDWIAARKAQISEAGGAAAESNDDSQLPLAA